MLRLKKDVKNREANRNLEVDKLVRVCAHLVVKAKLVFADFLSGEDKIALSLLLTLQDHLACGTHHLIVDIERTAGLDLMG